MAVTSVSYDGDGVDTDFDITFAYTSRSFVKAYVNGVITTAWTFLDADTIRFTVAPSVGTANVEIRRVTSTTPLVDFVAAASITDTDLDLAILQQLHVLEENQNNSLVGMQQSGGNWDATSDRIINLSLPLASTDAASKAYVDSITGSVADAEAAQAAAESAEDGAVAQAAAAAVSAAAASASALAADASADSIAAVYPISGMTAGQLLIASSATAVVAVSGEVCRLIASDVAASGTNVDIPLSGTYEEYEIVLMGVLPNTNNEEMEARFSVDSGATYRSTAGDYSWAHSAHVNGATINPDSAGDTSMRLVTDLDNVIATRQMRLTFIPGSGAGARNTLFWHGMIFSNSNAGSIVGGAALDAVSTRATHLRLFTGTGGGWALVQYYVYGIER